MTRYHFDPGARTRWHSHEGGQVIYVEEGRLRVQDRPGVLADVTRILSEGDISIEAMLQRAPAEGESETDIVILTHVALERRVDEAIARIEALPTVRSRVTRLRREDLG